MKKKSILIYLSLILWGNIFAQSGIINPLIYNKPLPSIISIANQPTNFNFTSHIVNIKIPQSEIDNWNASIEQQYLQTLFNFIPDKHFVITQYSGFYFPTASGFTGLHHMNFKNTTQNIGLNIFNHNYIPVSQKFLGITRMERDWFLRPNSVTHELFHQWNSFLESANYWLIDPTYHTGLIEQNTSVFENNRSNFQPSVINNDRYKYNQYFSNGFVSPLEGYLAGLWDMPNSLRTLKNFYHGSDVTNTFDSNCNCFVVDNVQAEGIVDLTKNQLLQMYGGERVPNYLNNNKSYDCVVVVFSAIDFLSDNDLKIFHYASALEEFEGTASQYNQNYDEIYVLGMWNIDQNYGRRQLNPYHATSMNMHFYTNIFNSPLSATENNYLRNEILIYPNPTNSFITIRAKQNSLEDFEYKIVDLTGRIVKFGNSKFNEQINIESLSSGNYIIQIETEKGEKLSKKLIKN